LLLHLFYQVGIDLLWPGEGGKTLHRFAVAVDQELGEVPLDLATEESAQLLFEVSEDRMCILTVYIDFRKHGESDTIVDQAPFRYRLLIARFLVCELITEFGMMIRRFSKLLMMVCRKVMSSTIPW